MRLQTNQKAKFTSKSNYILTCILYKACSDWSKPTTLGNVAQIKKSEQNHSPSARVSRTFINFCSFPTCFNQTIQTRKPLIIVYSLLPDKYCTMST